MSLELKIQDFTADEICDLLLRDDSQVTDILANAVRQLFQEMAGLEAKPSAAELLRQLERAA